MLVGLPVIWVPRAACLPVESLHGRTSRPWHTGNNPPEKSGWATRVIHARKRHDEEPDRLAAPTLAASPVPRHFGRRRSHPPPGTPSLTGAACRTTLPHAVVPPAGTG